jgi:hypothetical protein
MVNGRQYFEATRLKQSLHHAGAGIDKVSSGTAPYFLVA